MAQATLSCRFAAIHLVTPLLGFFRDYLPSRIRTLFVFFDNLGSRTFVRLPFACLFARFPLPLSFLPESLSFLPLPW